jgi:hypothetical protein
MAGIQTVEKVGQERRTQMKKLVKCYKEGGHLRRANGKLVGGRDDPNLMLREGSLVD